MRNNKGFSLIETALVMLVLSATVFAFINIINIQVQKTALKNYSKDLTNTYQIFLDAFIKYVQKVNPTTSTTYTCTTIKADPDKFLPDSFSCIDNLGQSLEGRVSFKGTSVYGYFVYGNLGGANVSNYLNAFDIKTFTQLINLFIQMTGDLDNTSKKFLVIQNKTNIYQINSTNYVTATTADIFGGDTYLSSLPVFNFAGKQYTIGLWSLAQQIISNTTADENYPITSCADVRNLPPYSGLLYDDASGPVYQQMSNLQQVCGNYLGYPLCCAPNKYSSRFNVYFFPNYSGYKYKMVYTVSRGINYSTTFNFNNKIANEVVVVVVGAGYYGFSDGGGAGGLSIKKCTGTFSSITVSFVADYGVTVTIPGCATITANYARSSLGETATGGDLNYTGGNGKNGGGGGGLAGGNSVNGNGGGVFSSDSNTAGGGINGGLRGADCYFNRSNCDNGNNGGYGGGGGRGGYNYYDPPSSGNGGNGGWGGGGGWGRIAGNGGVGGGGGGASASGGPSQVTILYNVQ